MQWQGYNKQADVDARPLLNVDINTLDKLVISDAQHTVTLEEKAGQWQLPELNNLPVLQGKLTPLLDKLSGLRSGWPITTTSSSHQRFEVAQDKFQRKIQLFSGDSEPQGLLLGTSPGFKKAHLRNSGEDEVYTAELSGFEFPVKAEQWLDKSLLAVKAPQKLKTASITLQKSGESWQLAPEALLAQGTELDQEKVKQLASAISSLRIIGVAEQEEQTNDAVSTLETSNAEKSWHYSFIRHKDNYYVRRSDFDALFTLSKSSFEKFADLKLASLSKQVKPPADTSQKQLEDEAVSDETIKKQKVEQ